MTMGNPGNPRCLICRGRGGFMAWIPSRKRYGWRKCNCMTPTKEINDLMRRVHAREGQQFQLPGIDRGKEEE